MCYRNGELSPASVDRGYPYQSPSRKSSTTRLHHHRAVLPHPRASVSPRGHVVRIGHQLYVVTCFVTPADADNVREAFDGYQ
jgi:hypothetical protein